MTKSKHTDGPWRELDGYVMAGPACIGHFRTEVDPEKARANARLAAAAPDMLAALIHASNQLNHQLTLVCQAIDKATGEYFDN